jgi:hypothetical protein
MDMQRLSVRTVLEHHYFAGTAVWKHIGIPPSIGRYNGLQPTTPKFCSIHWGLLYALATLVHHVRKPLRYMNLNL